MAWIIGDSFDLYNTPADAAAGMWAIATNFTLVTTTRFGTGQAIQTSSDNLAVLTTPSFSNVSTVYIAFAYNFTGNNTGRLGAATIISGFTYYDGASAQCSVCFRNDGAIVVTNGTVAGAIVATFPNAVFQGCWTHFQIKVVIDNSAGSVTIRTNGAGSDTFSATGLNTRNGTSAAQTNKISYATGAGNSLPWLDDLLIYDSTGSAPNTWVGDVRCCVQYPKADTATKNFTPNLTSVAVGNTSSAAGSRSVSTGTAVSNALAGGDVVAYSGTVASISVTLNAGFTGNLQGALYDAAGNKLATTNTVTNPSSGAITLTFSSPPSVDTGRGYYAFVAADTTMVLSTAGSATEIYIPTAYGTWPTTISFLGSSGNKPIISFNVVPSNSGLLNQTKEDGDTSYVSASTVGTQDYYSVGSLTSVPSSILAVVARGFAKKSDSGAKTGNLVVSSGGSTSTSATATLSTSYNWINSLMLTNPNGGVAWTASAVNAVTFGPYVAS